MQLADLVRRIRRGEKEAVKELVATYGSGVYQRAYERTKDKELAREAARQTFGQFVAIVQQQPEDDGWSLWFGDLIERNIATYAQISTDMPTIESELDQELDTARVAKPVAAPLRFDTDANEPVAPLRNAAETSYERAPQTKKGGLRDEIFDEAYQRSEIYDDVRLFPFDQRSIEIAQFSFVLRLEPDVEGFIEGLRHERQKFPPKRIVKDHGAWQLGVACR